MPFPYRYEKGHPWSYTTLKAPFDFEVLYPEEQVRTQLEQIEAEHAPYYLVHPEIAREQKKRLTELVKEQIRIGRNDTQFDDLVRNSTAYLSFGQQLLDKIYEHGIGGPELEGLRQDNLNATIFLVNGSDERRTPVSVILTPRAAQDFLTDTLPYSSLRQPELLLSILEKVLIPNVLYSDSLTFASKRRKISAVVSTGITVRKGEVIVQRTELVNDEILRKLDSLNHRFDVPKGFRVVAGYEMLAFLLFYFYFIRHFSPGLSFREQRERLLLPPVLILAMLVLINFTSWLGLAVALLIPVWGIPIFLRRPYERDSCWIIWIMLLTLSTVSLDWSAGWLALQVAGAAGVYQLSGYQKAGWFDRVMASLITAALQVFVWLACLLAGKIPASLQTTDVILFILAGNGVLLLFYPIDTLLKENPEGIAETTS